MGKTEFPDTRAEYLAWHNEIEADKAKFKAAEDTCKAIMGETPPPKTTSIESPRSAAASAHKAEPEAETKPTVVLPRHINDKVLPILKKAMGECARERPAFPLEFIAQYLLTNNPEHH